MCVNINLTSTTADTTAPDISWNTPSVNNTATANTTLLGFNVTVSETGGSAILNINGTANYTMSWSGNYAYYTFNGANQTTYCGRVYANDTSGNLNLSTSSRCITVNLYSGGADTTPPTVTITSPSAANYTTTSIWLNASSNENESMWYSLNGGTNYTMNLCYQETANISTSCGGLSTGTYRFEGDCLNTNQFYDGDWSTGNHGGPGASDCYYYENYSILTNFDNYIFTFQNGPNGDTY
jgi:hypothetical protein